MTLRAGNYYWNGQELGRIQGPWGQGGALKAIRTSTGPHGTRNGADSVGQGSLGGPGGQQGCPTQEAQRGRRRTSGIPAYVAQAICRKHARCTCHLASKLGAATEDVKTDLVRWLLRAFAPPGAEEARAQACMQLPSSVNFVGAKPVCQDSEGAQAGKSARPTWGLSVEPDPEVHPFLC